MGIVDSFVPGRIRLRSSLLRDGETAAMLQGAMSAIPGVRSADLNAATGSLLLKYDADALPLEKLSPLLPLLEQVKELDNEPPSPKRTAALRSLLVQALAKVL